MAKNSKLDIIKSFDKIEKKVKLISPTGEGVKTSVIKISSVFQGKRWKFKYPPKTVLEIANEYMGYTFLSDNQKTALIEVFGNNPEEWDTTWSDIIMLVGQGGGKNTWIEVAIGYVLQFLVNLVNPYEAFSFYCQKTINPINHFEITNNSMVGQEQAKTVFFDRIKQVIRAMKEPDTKENIFTKYIGLDLRDEGIGDMKTKTITFPTFFPDSGRIKLHSLDSGISTFEGKNIFIALMDEPSRAVTEATYNNAKLLYKGLTGNLDTRFPNKVGKLFAFSYPNTSEYDLTYELATGEERDSQNILKEEDKKVINTSRKIFIFSTFQFNPSTSKSQEKFRIAYANDPEDAKARFECIKSKTKYAFFQPHVEKISECVMKDLQNRVTFSQSLREKKLNDGSIKTYTAIDIYDIKGDEKYRSWAFDTSINKDRFVLESGYSETLERSFNSHLENQMVSTANKKVIIDLIIVWTPSAKYTVDYQNVNEVIERLLDAFPNSISVTGDKYQMESIAALFEQRGIRANIQTFSNTIQMRLYTMFRTAVFNNIVGYINHPLLIEELERVQKINDNKIDHPLGFSKDLADAAVQLYGELIGMDYSQIADNTGLDRYKDAKLIDITDKFIRASNEAKLQGIFDRKEYICERLNISEEEYNKIILFKDIYFPKPS